MKETTGLIVKGIGGFYYVKAADSVLECRARGIFRKNKQTPLAGDQVKVSLPETGMPMVDEILPRRNSLIRPPIANLDRLFIVVSVCDPGPNTLVVDKLISIAEHKEIEPVVIVNKTDLADPMELLDIYRRAGIPVCRVSAGTGEGIEQVRDLLTNRICAFTGNSGVGKSSLLNRLDPRLGLATGDISKKLGRGRHTTRQVELYEQENGGYLADTPGFSSLDLERCETVLAGELAGCFREFAPFVTDCKFTSCSHTGEKGCAVKAAVDEGKIHPSRYRSYVELYNAVKNIKEWELK